MIVKVSYRQPGDETCSVISCVEMSAEQLAGFRARIAAGENRGEVAEECERNFPRAHRKLWRYAEPL